MANNYLNTSYKTYFIKSGELAVTYKPVIVWTVLGSCVSVILYNKRTKTGAICHAQYPKRMKSTELKCFNTCPAPCHVHPCKGKYLFAQESIEFMIQKLLETGLKVSDLEANIYGGGTVLRLKVETEQTVGYLNTKAALATLKKYKIKINKEDIGGKRGRTIYYYSDTGEVKVKTHGTEVGKSLNDIDSDTKTRNEAIIINPED